MNISEDHGWFEIEEINLEKYSKIYPKSIKLSSFDQLLIL